MDEQESQGSSRDAATTSRSLNVVHYMEREPDEAARLVAAALDRSAGAEGTPAVLVVLPSPDEALSFSEAVRVHRSGNDAALLPVTSVARGRRLLAAGTTAIAAAPSHLAQLVGESKLALGQLPMLVFVWPEDVLADDEQRTALESLLGELPKTTERVAVCATRSAELTAFLERSMWRARAVDHAKPTVSATGVALRVLSAAPVDQVRALRTMLDAFDPDTTVLLTFSDASESAARNAAALLGSSLIQVSRGLPEGRFSLGVIYDDVPTAEALTAAAGVTGELLAIVRPSRLAALHKVAGDATPLTWTGTLANVRSAHDSLRDEIRGTAISGSQLPWVPLIEPLLADIDAVDIAATALMLLDRERRKAKRAALAPAAAPAVSERPARDARPRSFDDRPPPKREFTRDRPERSFSPRGDRPERSFSPRGDRPDRGASPRGDRPERGFSPRGDRPGGFSKRPGGFAGGARKRDDDPRRGGPPRDRGERPRRDDRGGPPREGAPRFRDDRGERPVKRDDIERVPRAANEGREWSERGERLKNSRKGPRRGGDA